MIYAKGSDAAEFEIRIDGLDGPLIAELVPTFTGFWCTFSLIIIIRISDVVGIHDVYFIAREDSGVANLKQFIFPGPDYT